MREVIFREVEKLGYPEFKTPASQGLLRAGPAETSASTWRDDRGNRLKKPDDTSSTSWLNEFKAKPCLSFSDFEGSATTTSSACKFLVLAAWSAAAAALPLLAAAASGWLPSELLRRLQLKPLYRSCVFQTCMSEPVRSSENAWKLAACMQSLAMLHRKILCHVL